MGRTARPERRLSCRLRAGRMSRMRRWGRPCATVRSLQRPCRTPMGTQPPRARAQAPPSSTCGVNRGPPHEGTLRRRHYASGVQIENEQRVAVIDLGSNSFRMVVFKAAGGSWEREDELSEAVRIGEGLAATGRLGEAAMERALVTLDAFARVCDAHGLGDRAIDAVATSAIRDAENGAELLERVRMRTGLDVRVLSREQEARYGYLAAVNSTTLT